MGNFDELQGVPGASVLSLEPITAGSSEEGGFQLSM